jgi:hypothetical protein
MDGDFFNRSYAYLKFFEPEFDIIENLHVCKSKHFIFTKNETDYFNEIDDCLKRGEKIFVISQSAGEIELLYEKYKKKYKVACHTSNTDDEIKKKLKNVNEFWGMCVLILFSPCVSVGISYDKEDVDRVFVILTSKSCGSRDVIQMLSRPRHVKNKNIKVLIQKNIPYSTNEFLYNYDDVEDYYKTNEKKFFTVIEKQIVGQLYYDIVKYNKLETLNDIPANLVTSFIKLLTKKGHSYECDYSVSEEKMDKKEYSLMKKEKLLNVKCPNKDEIGELLKKQKMACATEEDKLKIEKYDYIKKWNITEKDFDEDFINLAYGKTYILVMLRKILDMLKNTDAKELENEIEKLDLEKFDENIKITIILDLVKKLGFGDIKDGIKLTRDELENGRDNMNKKSIFFKENEYCIKLFGMKKYKKFETNKAFLGFVNGLLKNYGLKINKINKTDTKNKNKTLSFYILNVGENYKKFL